MVRVRFAPSPTGYLHLGNARTALLNWLFAHRYKGSFILRLDDTDRRRVREEYIQDIQENLKWMGLMWDDMFFQTDRYPLYHQVIESLKSQKRLYPCYETAEELEQKRQLSLQQGRPPVYDRASLYNPQEGRPAHWRFLLDHTLVTWDDLVQSQCSYHTSHLSDPIVIREDGSISYLLSSVIDDHAYGISHIIRGADHLTNTAIQIQMFHALGALIPCFGHFSLMTDTTGEKISKRKGATSLYELRQQGFLPLAICQALASLGLPHTVSGSLEDIAATFDLGHYGKAMVQLDREKLHHHNHSLIQQLSYEEACHYSQDPRFTSDLWYIIRNNMTLLTEISLWIQVCHASMTFATEDPEFCKQAASHLPSPPWDEHTWEQWISRLSIVYPSEKKSFLAQRLRRLLTGQEKGPQMRLLFPLIDPACVTLRLTPVAKD